MRDIKAGEEITIDYCIDGMVILSGNVIAVAKNAEKRFIQTFFTLPKRNNLNICPIWLYDLLRKIRKKLKN